MQENIVPQRRTFASWVAEQRQGALHAELTEKLAELTAACVELEKKGKLTLTITVEPQKDKVTLFVTDDVKVAAPAADRASALYFADADGNLRREDPRQMKLPLREVPPRRSVTTEGGGVVEVDVESGEVASGGDGE